MKKKTRLPTYIPIDKLKENQEEYIDKVYTDTKYSLEIDPENKYNLTEEKKNFIKNYINFKCINSDKEHDFYEEYAVQQEIRRLNLAMYHRQFATKILTVDQIGGYLTSILMDENIAMIDRLETKDKLKVAQMIIDLNKLKQESFSDPNIIDMQEIKEKIETLSVDDIKQMIEQPTNEKTERKKEKLIANLSDNLSLEEIAYLSTLSVDELIELEKLKNGGK